MQKYKVNKQKCISCQVCFQTCPGAIKINDDGKAEIVNSKELEKCGGEKVCPFGAIEKIDEERKIEAETPSSELFSSTQPSYQTPPADERGLDRGRGMGAGRGRGRGLGIGPRDGRGKGKGGGGRR